MENLRATGELDLPLTKRWVIQSLLTLEQQRSALFNRRRWFLWSGVKEDNAEWDCETFGSTQTEKDGSIPCSVRGSDVCSHCTRVFHELLYYLRHTLWSQKRLEALWSTRVPSDQISQQHESISIFSPSAVIRDLCALLELVYTLRTLDVEGDFMSCVHLRFKGHTCDPRGSKLVKDYWH